MVKYAPIALLVSVACVGCASAPQGGGGLFTAMQPGRTDYSQQLSLARLSERQNKTESAERIYHAILKQQPDNVVANHRMAVMAAKRGLQEDAGTYFQTAEAGGLRTAEFYNDYGYWLYLQNKTEPAEQYFQKSLAVDGSYRAAHNNLGLILGEQQRYEESLKHFMLAVDEGEAYANLAFIQSQMGDLDSAEGNYHRALEMNPELRRAAQALVQIAGKRGHIQPVQQTPTNREKSTADQVAQHDDATANVAEVTPEQVAPVSYMAPHNPANADAAKTQQMVADAGQASLETKVESSMTSKSGLHYPQIMSVPPSLKVNQMRQSASDNPSASQRLGFAENSLRDTTRSE
ncbi:tetratricopeptide repeat protein [Blastopirellula sp. JC732]|uniref:Tetratricopeptide repeat protein n=1 Tax=Blastopirellula sediminis TaxID=2894196 RepID=A0A9X1MRU2_9BACT|nr:tetratricopeptide repeat protein [Blastopirellula sediminis]MCC9605425.1 tetratricopeptide repeat protein [Blastopirellula sediminis]MCC9631275.1 tetratricopeptide repeat protein [Blastopirellula sediminis]